MTAERGGVSPLIAGAGNGERGTGPSAALLISLTQSRVAIDGMTQKREHANWVMYPSHPNDG